MISFFARVCNIKVSNFTTNWNDGIALSHVIEYLHPGLFPDINSLCSSNKVDNCHKVITLAWEHLGIPSLISAEDMADPDVDKYSMMTYLSYFIKLCIKKIYEWAQSLLLQRTIKNMSTDWCSGIHLTALINNIRPGILPDCSVLDEEHGINNVTKAMGMAEYSLGIEPSLTPAEMTGSTIDEMSVAEYLAPFMLIEITKPAANPTTVEIQASTSRRPVLINLSGFDSMSIISLQMRLPSGKIECIDVNNLGKGNAEAVYVPPTAGRYELIVKSSNDEIQGSPYKIEIPRLIDYINLTLSLPPGLEVFAGKVDQLKIVCDDTDLVSDKLFDVVIHGEGLRTRAVESGGFLQYSNDIQYHIKDEGNKHYFIEFFFPKVGEYSLSIFIDKEHIKGSPVNLKCRSIGSASGDGLTKAVVGRITQFDVTTPVGSQQLTVSMHDSQGELQHQIQTIRDGLYKVTFEPRCTGELKIDVRVDNVHIIESPFHLNVIESVAYIEGRNIKHQVSASCVKRPLTINLTGVQDISRLLMEIKNPLDHVDKLQLISTGENTGETSYIPIVAGKHAINMKINGDDIPGSPFDINIAKLVEFIQFENIDLSQVQIAAGRPCQIKIVSKDPNLLKDRLLSVSFEEEGLKCSQVSAGLFNPGAKEIQYSLQSEGNGNYLLQFLLPQDGYYRMSLMIDNDHITGSPFDITVMATGHASKCVFSGTALTQGHVVPTDSDEVQFKLDCSNAGEGELSVHAVDPQGESVKVVTSFVSGTTNVYTVNVYPERGGIHQLHVYWGGKPITGSPFKFEVCNPNLVRLVNLPKLEWFSPVTGEMISFDVDVSQAGRGQLTAYAVLPDGRKENFIITDKGSGLYSVKYTFTVTSLTQIFVMYSGASIMKGSITVRDAPRPNRCVFKQTSETTAASYTVGKAIEFTVDCTDSGTGELTVKATGPDKQALPVDIVVDASNNKLCYHIKVVPAKAGPHCIIVQWAGLSIPGSPFHYEIIDPSGVQLLMADPVLTPFVGQPIKYKVNLSNVGKGTVTAKAILAGGKTVDVKVIDEGHGIIVVDYQPITIGSLEIFIYFNGKKLTSIPVTVSACPEPSKVTVGFPKLQNNMLFEAGNSLEFSIDTSEAGGGELSAKFIGPDNQEIPIQMVHELRDGRKVCVMKMTPEHIGSYSVIILWADQHVSGSPFKFEVADSRQVTCTGLPGVEGFALVAGEMIDFSIDISKAGKGKLVAQLVAADGSVKTLTAKASNGIYTIKERFIVTGLWRLVVLYNGRELVSTPVEIRKAPEPNKCIAEYSLLHDTYWNVGNDVQFTIDCTDAGGGELEVKVTNPFGSEISATKSIDTAGGRRIYILNIIPESEGVYSIAATWAGKTIRGSPFSFSVANPKKVKIFNLPSANGYAPLTGETLSFEVDTSKALRGKLNGQVISSSGAVSQLVMREQTEGIHVIKQKLIEAGVFEIKLFYNEVEVLHFPFTVSMAPIPSKCVAHFNIEKNHSVSVGQTVAFRVDCFEAGAGELTAMASCGIQKNDVPVHTSLDTTGGRCIYLVTLLPEVVGPYFVTILWADKPIPGSPFIFQASDESQVKILNIPDPATYSPVVGDTMTFEIDTSEAGKGKVVAKALYEGQQPQEFSTNEKGKGLFIMKHVFSRAGSLNVPILFNGTQLSRLVYIVKPAPDASKCNTTFVQESEYLVNVGKLIELSVDCANAGTGELTVKCTNPQGNCSDAIITKDTSMGGIIYRVQIQAVVLGTYSIVVLWAGTAVPDSPFTVEVADPNQVKFLKLPKAEEFHPLTGDSIAFDIDATKAGKGSFMGKIAYEDTSEDIKIISKGTGMFGIKHLLSYAAQATITIHYNGVQLLTMVFTIRLAPNASKCKVMIPEQGKYLTNVGQLIEFMVDCTEAGTGELLVKANGPRREIEINSVMESIGMHKIQFSPDQAGTYSVNVLWANKSVPDSPFKFEVADPNAVKFFNLPKVESFHPLTGDCINFDADVSRAGKGSLQVQCVSDGSTKDLQLTSKRRGMFSLLHTFERPCQVQLLVFYNGVQLVVRESTVRLAPDASKCCAIIKDQQQYLINAGQLVELSVNTSEAGSGVLTAKVVGPQRKEVDVDIIDCEDGNTIQFIPKEAGTYSMTVLWAGKAIPLSPFPFEIANPKLVKFLNLPKEQNYCPLTGENVTFSVDVNKAGRGKLRALVNTPDGESSDIQLVEKGKGVYLLKYPVASTGLLQFTVIFNGVKVLTLDYEAKLAPDSTKCHLNLHDTLLMISQPITFSVDCSEAGVGKFTVKTRDPMREEMQATITETNSEYTVQAETHLVGEHSIDILWGGKVVGSGPAIFNVFDPTKVKVTNLPIAERFCAMVNETLAFEADTSKAGKGRLTCQIITDDGKLLDIEPTQKGQGTDVISYKFTQAGSLELVLLYNNIKVFTSPWTCQVVDISKFQLSVPTQFIKLGDEAKLEITNVTGESAHLKVTAVRGRQPCAIQMSYGDTGAVGQLLIEEVGEYKIEARCGNKTIAGSPMVINGCNPDKCQFANQVSTIMHVGEAKTLVIKSSEAGPGTLKCIVSNDDLLNYNVKSGVLSSQINLEPKAVGCCEIAFTWADFPIPSLQIDASIVDASVVQVTCITSVCQKKLKTNDNISFLIDGSEAGQADMEFNAKGPVSKYTEVDIVDNGDGTYAASFIATQVGKHSIDVTWGGKPVKDMPLIVDVKKMVDHSSSIRAEGDALRLGIAGRKETVTIIAKDTGLLVDGDLSATMITADGYDNDIKPIVEIKDKGNGVYVLTYIVELVTGYQLNITHEDQHITDSPFTIDVKPAPDASKCRVIFSDELVPVGTTVEVDIDCREAGYGELSFKVKDQAKKSVQASVSQSNNIYTAKFNAATVGEFIIEAYWSGSAIGDGQYQLNAFDPKKAKLINLPNTEEYIGLIGSVLEFDIDVTKAGKGTVTAEVELCDESTQSVELTEKLPGVYGFSHHFKTVGLSKLLVFFNGLEVLQSTWSCDVVDFGQFAVTTLPEYCRILDNVQFTISGITTESKHFKVTATHTKQPAAVQLSYTDTGTLAQFVPDQVGEYKVDVKHGGKQIAGSPFVIKVCNPAKCKVIGSLPSIIHIGETKSVNLKTNEVGPGELQYFIQTAELLDCNIKKAVGGTLQCDLTARAVGMCSVELKWSGFAIPNTTFQVQTVNASLVTVTCRNNEEGKKLKTGDKIFFVVNAIEAGQADVEFISSGPSTKYKEVDIVDNGDGTYVASFIATQVGKHIIDVTWGGKPVKDMPLIVDVKKTIDCSSIRAEGDALRLGIAGRKETITIIAKDTGLLAHGDLSATMITADRYDNDIKPIVEIKEKGNGMYILTYVAEVATDYQLNITHEDRLITDSPFTIDVKPAPNASKCQVILTDTLVLVESTIEFDIDCREAGYGELTVKGTDPAKKSVPVEVSDNNHIFSVKFNAVLVGTYTLEVLWSGNAVSGSPVKFDIFDPSKVTYSKLTKSADFLAIVGQSLAFDIDTSKAGKGQVTTQVILSESDTKHIDLNEKNALYNFKYDFVQTGTFELIILFNNFTVLADPWKCSVVDISQFVITTTPEFVKMRDNVTIEIVGVPTDSKHLTVTASNMRQPTSVSLVYTDSAASATFCAEFVGEYKVEIKYGSIQLNGSPLIIKSCNPDACQISGQIPSILHVKESKSVTIQTSKAGPGLLHCTTDFLTEGTPLEYDIKSDARGTTLMLKALTVGTANVGLEWANFPIPKVPFEVQVVDASLVVVKCVTLEEEKKIKIADVVVFEIDSRTAGRAPLQFNVMGPRTRYKKAVVKDNNDGTFTASFIAAQVGSHKVELLWGGRSIPQSPITFVVKKAIGINTIRAEGSALKIGFVKKEETVNIIANDSGLLKDGNLCAEMSKVDGSDNISVEMKETGLGSYILSYIAQTLGVYQLQINYEGKPITHSPFCVDIKLSPDASKCIAEFSETKVLASTTPQFTVNCKEAGFGEITVKIKDPTKKKVQAKISEDEENLYTVSFEVTVVGEYTIEVLWSGASIPNSPFSLDCFDPSKVVLRNLPVAQDFLAFTGDSLTVDADARKAGKGTLTSRLILAGGSAQDIDLSVNNLGMHQMMYNFENTGSLEVAFFFNGHRVPTAWSCNVFDFNAFSVKSLVEFVLKNENVKFEIVGISEDTKHLEVNTTCNRSPIALNLDYKDGSTFGSYTVTQVGEYITDVKFGGKHIKGSPFTIKAWDPEKCQVVGLPLDTLCVGEKSSLSVKHSDAGPGYLGLSLEEKDIVEYSIKSSRPGTSQIEIIPKMVGSTMVELTWIGHTIPATPFPVNVINPSAVHITCTSLADQKKLKTNLSVVFEIDTTEAGEADLDVTIAGPLLTYAGINVISNNNGIYTASFTPTQVGTHTVTVLWGGRPTKDVPLKVDVKKAVDADKITATGDALQYGIAGKKELVTVLASDSGLLKDGDLTAAMTSVESLDDNVQPQVEIKDKGSGTYSLMYVVEIVGQYLLHINHEGQPIKGSPFNITVRPPPDASMCCFEAPDNLVLVDSTIEFDIDCREGGYGAFSIKVKDPLKNFTDVQITENNQVFTVKFVVSIIGEYTIETLWSKVVIPGSPFEINTFDPLKVRTIKLPVAMDVIALIGEMISFDLDVTKAGKGTLASHVIMNKGSAQSVGLEEICKGIYKFSHKLTEVGSMEIVILYNDMKVLHLPWICQVVNFSKLSVTLPSENFKVKEVVEFDINGIAFESKHLQVTASHIKRSSSVHLTYTESTIHGQFTAEFVGEYKLKVKYGNKQITGSPFVIKSFNPDNCQMTDELITMLHIGETKSMNIKTFECGPSMLKCLPTPIKGSEITHSIKSVLDGGNQLSLTGIEVGVYDISLSWADFPVPNTPFRVNVVDSSLVKVTSTTLDHQKKLKTGDRVMFNIDTTEAGKAQLDFKVVGPLSVYNDIEVTETGEGTFMVLFVVTQVGAHKVEVLWGGKAAMDTPVKFNVKKSIDYSSITAEGGALKCGFAGKSESVMVLASESSLLKEGDLTAVMKNTVDDTEQAVVEMKDQGNGAYLLTYNAATAGDYLLSINHEENPIAKSPFTITILEPPNASKCQLQVAESLVIVNKAVSLTVDCTAAGHGELAVVIKDPAGHEIEYSISELNKVFTVTFTPTSVGDYAIEALWSGKTIPTIPLVISTYDPSLVCFIPAPTDGLVVCNPENCKLSKEFPRLFHVGENNTINIDASTAGPGALTCFLHPLSGGKRPLQYEIIEKECTSYDLLLKPLEVGSCQVTIMWGGYGIREGVLEVDVVDTRAVKVTSKALNQDKVTIDEEVAFNIDGREAGKAPVAFKVKGPKAEYATAMVNNQNGTVTGFFTPWHTGVHTVEVLWGGRHVRFSPFKLTVRRLVDPTKIVIQGDNQGCVGLPGVLRVLTLHKDLLEEDGLAANMVREVGANLAGQEPKVELIDNHTTVYKLTYLVPISGDYKLSVTYDKADVSNSPFTLSIRPPADSDKCRVQHSYLDEDHNIENPVDFSVDVTHAGSGSLITKVLDPNNSQVQVYSDVDHTPLNVIHYLKFKSKSIGKYTVSILWDNEAIPGTPFTVNVIDPSKCNIKGLPLKDNTAVLNKLFSYSVCTKSVGYGKVHSVISRPGQNVTILEPMKKGEHEYQFQYKPDRMGKFSILVFFSKKELNGSPFPCKTVDTGFVGVVLLAEVALVCEPYEFHIQGSFPDTKAVKAIAHGSKDDIAVEVYPPTKKLHVARFIPLQAGSYDVFVEYSGQQVPKSPFSIACVDPGKCKIIEDLPLILQVGRKAEFQVKTVDAGPGTISLLINNEQENRSCGTAVEAQGDNNTHRITLMPKIIGGISIHVLFAGHGIPRTPFRAQICDASKCRIAADFIKTGHSLTSKAITFTLVAVEAGVAKPIITAQGPSTQYTVDVMEVSANTYECAFTPWQAGKQTIQIIWGIVDIPGSPFEISVGHSDEGVCNATGPGLTEAVAGEPTKFDIHTTKPGLVDDGILVVDVRAVHYKADVQIEDEHNGLYTVTYIAPSPGAYLASITYNDKHIAGSPFKIRTIAGADATQCHAYGPALESKDNRYTDVAQEFYVDTANAGRGKLNVYVRSPNNEKCRVHVKEKDGNIYSVKFNAEDEGKYTVKVFWSKRQIPGSPFKIKVKQAANAGMVKAHGPGLRNGRLGDCREFTIETKNAGTGTLTTRVHGVRGSFKVEVHAKDPEDPHVLTARYIPTIAGEFVIFIRWAGAQIPGSPFKVIITDPSGFDPSVPASNVPYSIEPSYKPSQDKKARKKSTKSEIDYHDDEEQLLTKLPEDDEDEEVRIPTTDSNAKNTNITDPSGFDPSVPVSNVPYSIEPSYKPSQDKKARKKSTKSKIDYHGDEEQSLTKLPEDDEDEEVRIPTPDSNAKNTNITDPSGFDPSVLVSNVPYSIKPSYKPSQDKKARKKSTKSKIDYHDDEEQSLTELPEDDKDEEVRIPTPDSNAKNTNITDPTGFDPSVPVSNVPYSIKPSYKPSQDKKARKKSTKSKIDYHDDEEQSLTELPEDDKDEEVRIPTPDSNAKNTNITDPSGFDPSVPVSNVPYSIKPSYKPSQDKKARKKSTKLKKNYHDDEEQLLTKLPKDDEDEEVRIPTPDSNAKNTNITDPSGFDPSVPVSNVPYSIKPSYKPSQDKKARKKSTKSKIDYHDDEEQSLTELPENDKDEEVRIPTPDSNAKNTNITDPSGFDPSVPVSNVPYSIKPSYKPSQDKKARKKSTKSKNNYHDDEEQLLTKLPKDDEDEEVRIPTPDSNAKNTNITDPSGFDPSVPVSNVPYSIKPSYKPSQDKKARKKSTKSKIDYHDDEEQSLTELPEDDKDEEVRIPTPDSNAKNTNITDPSGFDPSVPVSNAPYSIKPSYKPSQDKKARKKSTKSKIDYHDDEEQSLTELPEDDKDEEVRIPTPDSNAKNTNITDPSGFDPSVPASNVPYSIEPSYKPSQDKKARKKSTKSKIDYHDDEEQSLTELPEDDKDEEVRIPTPDSNAKNTNITDPSGFDPSVPVSNVPYSIEPSYKPSQDKKARKKSTKSEIDYHDDEEQSLTELPENDKDEEVRIPTPDSNAKNTNITDPSGFDPSVPVSNVPYSIEPSYKPSQDKKARKKSTKSEIDYHDDEEQLLTKLPEDDEDEEVRIPTLDSDAKGNTDFLNYMLLAKW